MTRLPLIALLLAACSSTPDGSRMLPGIAEPRNKFVLTIHEVPLTAWPKCVGITWKADPFMAAMSVGTLSPLHACARVPRDDDLKPGQIPWCEIGVPKGSAEAFYHEVMHCRGFDHPRMSKAP